MKQHSPGFLAIVEESKQHIQTISPQRLQDMLQHNPLMKLIDVREGDEWVLGHLSQAIHLSKGIIERDIEKNIPDIKTPIVVYCSGGFRSALVAYNLHKMGYSEVYSLDKGMQGWIECGLTIENELKS